MDVVEILFASWTHLFGFHTTDQPSVTEPRADLKNKQMKNQRRCEERHTETQKEQMMESEHINVRLDYQNNTAYMLENVH